MIKDCDECGIPDQVKNTVRSIIHKHPASYKAQKNVMAIVCFVNIETGEPSNLCESCSKLVISGMDKGGMWE